VSDLALITPRRISSVAGAAVQRRPAVRYAVAFVPLVGALGVWALSLERINPNMLGKGGLPPVLPLSWYGALAVLISGASLTIWARRPNPWLMIAYIIATIVILYGTVPAITHVPQYSWLYKHVGVARLIAAHGGLQRNVDIYNRWPGFFALAASFSSWAHLDPLSFAAWAQPFFALLNAVMVGAVGLAIGRDLRVAGYSALIFTIGNWVGQGYFAPQAAAFTLTMALMLVFVCSFVSGTIREKLAATVARIVRRPQPPQQLASSLGWTAVVSSVVVLTLDVAIVVTHQLTPFMVLIEIGALLLLGVTRARWLILAMTLITVGFLAPNLTYMAHHYGLFTGFNPVNNLAHGDSGVAHLNFFESNAGGILSVALIVLMLFAAVRRARLGEGRIALTLGVLAVAPFGLLLAQDYNGEASLRVFLFSSPWRDVLIALGFQTLASHRVRQLAAALTCLLLVALFVQAFYGNDELTVIPTGEVVASEYYYAHAPAGSVLMQASYDEFPSRLGVSYAVMAGPQQENEPNLLGMRAFRNRPLGSADIPAVIAAIHQYAREGFLVFTTSGYHAEELFSLAPPGAVRSLERAVAESGRFRLWYATGDARIYELVN
jgi:hypothetical protein